MEESDKVYEVGKTVRGQQAKCEFCYCVLVVQILETETDIEKHFNRLKFNLN